MSLQISLGVALWGKSLIDLFHGFGVTSTYDEVLYFKISAGHSAAKSMENLGISDRSKDLVQLAGAD